MVLQEIAQSHSILKAPLLDCTNRGRLLSVIPQSFAYKINIHSTCICNEYVSLFNRHLIDRSYIPFRKGFYDQWSRRMDRYYLRDLQPISWKEYVERYDGPKKAQYVHAMHELLRDGWKKHYSVVRMFVKVERVPDPTKAPRAIQYRSPQFNIVLGSFVCAYEEAAYEQLKMGCASGTRVIAKGLNSVQRAELLLRKAANLQDPVFIELDHSKFDSTVRVDHLKSTHRRYRAAFGRKRMLHLTTRAQLQSDGYTKNGIKYRVKGTRMSGDPDTALGNSLINAEVITIFFQSCGISTYDFILDGDDAVLMCNRGDMGKLRGEVFGWLGFQAELQLKEDLHKVDFCQSRLVVGTVPVMVRNPYRCLSHSTSMLFARPPEQIPEWIAGVGACEIACNPGIPVLQAYGERLRAAAHGTLIERDFQRRMCGAQQVSLPVTDEARASLERAWGISIGTQLALEETIRHLPILKKNCSKSENVWTETLGALWRAKQSNESADASSSKCWWYDREEDVRCILLQASAPYLQPPTYTAARAAATATTSTSYSKATKAQDDRSAATQFDGWWHSGCHCEGH